MSVSGWSGSTLAWEGELGALKARLWPVFGRRETRESFGGFVDGLLSGVARKTGWLLAGQAGLESGLHDLGLHDLGLHDLGLPCAWVLADAVYGSDHQTR